MCWQAAKAFETGVEGMPELEVVGAPEMCNVAFKSRSKAVNVYKVPLFAGLREGRSRVALGTLPTHSTRAECSLDVDRRVRC